MSSTGKNGAGLVNWGLKSSGSDSSLETDGTGDSSDIFHSAKSNISSTGSATGQAGKSSEYVDLWRSLEKTQISDSDYDDNKKGPALKEYFEHPGILTDIQQRSSSQLPRWSETVETEILFTSTPELPDEQTSFPFLELPRNNSSSFGQGIAHREPFYVNNSEATAFPALNQQSKILESNTISTKVPFNPKLGNTEFGTRNPVPTPLESQNLVPTAFGTKHQAPVTLGSSFDFGLRQNRSSRPPSSPSSNPTSPRETIATRFKEQLGNMDRTAPEAGGTNSIPENSLYDIHSENALQWNTKDENIDAQVRSEKGVDDDTTDSLNIPSFGSSGKGQTRYLLEATKPKIFKCNTGSINPMISDHQFSKNQLSDAELNSRIGLHKNSENGASEVPISTDFLESTVKDTSGAALQNKSGNSNSASDDTPEDFLESPVQVPSGAGLQKTSGNSSSASEVPEFCKSTVRDISVPNYNKNNFKTVSKELGSLKISSGLQENFSLASHERFPVAASYSLGNHLNSLTGDIPTRLSVYQNDGAGYSSSINEAMEIPIIPPNSRIKQLRQEDRVEMCSIHSDYSYTSSDSCSSDAAARSSLVAYNNGTMGIPNAQQTNWNIEKVNHFTHQQIITDDGTEHLLRQTDEKMEDVKYNFDISHTKAWKSVLETDKIVFLVGFSESFKKLITLKFYEKYRSRGDVFRLNGPEDWKTCYKRSEPFAIFMEDAFGCFGTKFESISCVIENLATSKSLEAALFMMNPISFERNKESLRKCIKFGLADHVVHLEQEEHLLSEDEKHEILEKTSELVKENGRSLSKEDIDEIVCFENPIFFDTCKEFVVFDRHDENVLQFFKWPLDCLVGDIKYLKEKWQDGYYVLRLLAFHNFFDLSENGGKLAKYLSKSIHGNLPQILNQLVGSFLRIQNNEAKSCQANLSAPKFAFRHPMMQYAVLCTETDREFLIKYCPVSFLVHVIAKMTNMRQISFKDKKRSIAKRFIQEILIGKQAAAVVIHEIWNSEDFLNGFKQEWETVERQTIVSNLRSACESNFLYLAVFNKSPKLLYWIWKTCKENEFKLSASLIKKAIFATCVIGHFKHFRLLMERIKDVDSFCKEEFKDHILIPKRKTESSEIDFDETKCYPNITHTAVAFSRLDILDYLKSRRQNVNYIDSQGYTSLHVACHCGSDIEILEYLKENNGNVANVTDQSGNTCLHAACHRYDNIEIVTSLVKDFPKFVLKRNSSGQTPLHTAVGSGNTQIVELLLEISNKIQKNCLLEKDSTGCTVLHLACKVRNNLQMVQFLLERQPSLITIQDHHGNTALHAACQTPENTGVVEFLVSQGMDINMVNAFLRTPLHKACMAENVKVVRFLLEKENIEISMDKDRKYPHQLSKNKSIRAKMGYH